MSEILPTTETSNDNQSNGDSGSLQPEDHSLCAKLASLSYTTTLHDLPIELLLHILVKAVTMEVKDMKLAKSVWKEKSGPVISKLRSVCSRWSSSLATDFFQNELHRALGRMSQETFSVEILHQCAIEHNTVKVTSLGDDIFIQCIGDRIFAFDRNNLPVVKGVIRLKELQLLLIDIAACNVSKCLYILVLREDEDFLRVFQMHLDGPLAIGLTPWIRDLRHSTSTLSTSANGKIMIASAKREPNPPIVSIYDEDGDLQQIVMLSSDIYCFELGGKVLMKSNGNLVLVSLNEQRKAMLTEIDMNGSIVRQYQSSLGADIAVNFADTHGRIVISEASNKQELLDSELNLMMITGGQVNGSQPGYHHRLHYDSVKNELVGIFLKFSSGHIVVVFRFRGESDNANKA